MIDRILGIIGVVVLALFIIAGWVLYGSPLGFVPLLLCDILNLQTMCSA